MYLLKNSLEVKRLGKKAIPPYWQILKSPAVWTYILCDFANGWGLTCILVDGPNFIANVLNKDIADVSYFLLRINSLKTRANYTFLYELSYNFTIICF